MLIEKALSDLTVGHYVVKISKQFGNYALNCPGHIKNTAIINNLIKKKVQSVIIDTCMTITPEDSKSKSNEKNLKDKQRVIKEVKEAKEIFNESKNIQKNIFRDVLQGTALNLSPVIDIANKSIDAIFNSPDSLACVLNIREKNEYLLEHSVAVSIYITLFSRFLSLDRDTIEKLSIGAFLHDVGKIKITDKILNKPGKLTDDEYEIMKTHANHSIEIIKNTPGISALSLEVAALHHEKLDGNGYPFQKKGEEISLYGRMIAICDVFDALTATRVYKKGFSHPKAFAILRELGHKNHLDITLVDKFIKCIGVFPIGSLVQLNSNKLAYVQDRNDQNPIYPTVKSFYSVQLNNFEETQEIDLTESDDYIVKGVTAEEFQLDMDKITTMVLLQG
jgi:HD-GYP domain-containing protein (c-di-GMP phosphodiesterase class II)